MLSSQQALSDSTERLAFSRLFLFIGFKIRLPGTCPCFPPLHLIEMFLPGPR